MLRSARVCGVILGALLGVSGVSHANAQVQLSAVTPNTGTIVGTSMPEFVLEFSGAIDPASATTDTIQLYLTGADSMTPGADDTAVPLAGLVIEKGDAVVRLSPAEPLADGDYALVIFASGATHSGPGYALKYSHSYALLDVEPFKTLGEDFTLEAWARFDDWANYGSHTYGAIFDVGQSGRFVPGFWLSHEGAKMHFGFYLPDGTSADCIAEGALAKGAWRHLAAVSSSAGLKMYVNGELAASTPETFRPDGIAEHIQVALSGYSRWAGSYDYALGMFDEMRVWNIARTPEQIARTMHTPLSGQEPGLLVYHSFDQDPGDVLRDETGRGYDGNRNGTPHETSNAPLIEVPPNSLVAADGSPIDVFGDGGIGGLRVIPFRVDATPPRVVSIDPDVTECAVALSVPAITIGFDDEMNDSTLTVGNASLTAAGDGTFGNGNDTAIVLPEPTYDETSRTLTFDFAEPLPDDLYRFTLGDAVQNTAGVALDGEFPSPIDPETMLPSGDGVSGGAFTIEWTVVSSPDCNDNGVADECELADNDCNVNGVPDDCEEDCNGNGSPDVCDLLDGASEDCNENGIPDECDAAPTASALDFDGIGDWVRVPHSTLLEPTSELTVEAWIRPDSRGSSNNSRIVRTAGGSAAGYILSWRQSGTSKLELRIDRAAGGACRATDPTPVEDYFGTWLHVAGVYSASEGHCRLYVDGELKADEPDVGTLRYSNSDLYIGNFPGGGEDFDGIIDEVRIWDVARTEAELLESMSRPLLGLEPGLVGYWRFDEASGQVATDSSPYGHDGQLGANAAPDGDGRDPAWVRTVAPLAYGDCNGNGTLDECDIGDLTSDDCNGNGIPDECEPDEDCNTNGVQDICDLASGSSTDCNEDAMPDDCQLVDNDCDENGVPDDCEDCNLNGLADSCDLAAGTSDDCDENDVPDECEPDCNTNGVVDACDLRDGESFDFDDNGVPDECQPDCNENGFPDFVDIAFAYSADCNRNAVPDECDLDNGTSPDCNENLAPDECDLAIRLSTDCDANAIPDECQSDADLDGFPDACDASGDFDHDADIDLDDYAVLSLCLDRSGPDVVPPFWECLDAFDVNASGTIDLRDVFAFQRAFRGPR